MRDNEKGTSVLIDVSFSGGRNVIKKEAEKILKYKETQRMWNVNTNVMPVITVVTGTISESFRKYLSNVTGKLKIK
jgi:hypothetical protein